MGDDVNPNYLSPSDVFNIQPRRFCSDCLISFTRDCHNANDHTGAVRTTIRSTFTCATTATILLHANAIIKLTSRTSRVTYHIDKYKHHE